MSTDQTQTTIDANDRSTEVDAFLDKMKYEDTSDADKVDYTLLAAIKAYIDGAIDELTLGQIAYRFKKNPQIDDCLYKPEINLALEIEPMRDIDPEMMQAALHRLEEFYESEIGS